MGSWEHLIYPPELAEYQMVAYTMNSFLVFLCVLHYYWIVLFLNMYIKGILGGDTDDKQRGVKEEKKTELESKKVE